MEVDNKDVQMWDKIQQQFKDKKRAHSSGTCQEKKKKIQYLDVNTFRASRPGRKADMRPKKKRVKKKK